MWNPGCGCNHENNPCSGGNPCGGSNPCSGSNTCNRNNCCDRNNGCVNCCDILEQILANQGNNPNNSANTFKVLVFILLLCANQFIQQQVCFIQNIVCELLNYFICVNRQMMCRDQCMTQSLMECCANRK